MKRLKRISVIIPCYNEERGIEKVIKNIPKKQLRKLGFNVDVLVIDNNSTDSTAEIARKNKAKVIFESRQGKGNAIKTGFRNIDKDADYVVMLDGDNTYKSEEIPRLIEPLDSGFCDVIIGSRLGGKIKIKSMGFSHKMANWFFTFFIRHFYSANITDLCSGFFAWKKEVVDNLSKYLKSEGFSIEAEMTTKMAKLGYEIYSAPITYDRREGTSSLHPFRDTINILTVLFKNLRLKPKIEINQEYKN